VEVQLLEARQDEPAGEEPLTRLPPHLGVTLDQRFRSPGLWTSFSRWCAASILHVAARQRRLLRPTTAVVPVWLHHGERQRATVGEEEGGRRGLGEERRGGDWGARRDVRTVEGVRSRFHLWHVDRRRKATE
jgi:hypothetical protein